MISSSSPSPSPVRLSPVCVTVPSGLLRLLKKTKWLSERTLPLAPHMIALASRSKSLPVVVRTSQPSPTTTEVRFATPFVSETLPPLARLTPMELSSCFSRRQPAPPAVSTIVPAHGCRHCRNRSPHGERRQTLGAHLAPRCVAVLAWGPREGGDSMRRLILGAATATVLTLAAAPA